MPKIRAMWFGDGGSGKTHFVASFADPSLLKYSAPVLILNLFGNPEEVLAKEYEHLWVVDIDQLSDIDRIYTWLKTGQPNNKFRAELGIPEDVIFKTVAFDTFTEVQRLIINNATGLNDSAAATAGGKPSIQAWGDIQTRTLRLARLFLELDMNVFFSVYEKTYVNLDSGTATVSERRPCLDGASGEVLPGYLPLVGRIKMVKKDGELVPQIIWKSAGKTKNQLSEALSVGMTAPTGVKVYEALSTVYN
jgi:hypothetical protein